MSRIFIDKCFDIPGLKSATPLQEHATKVKSIPGKTLVCMCGTGNIGHWLMDSYYSFFTQLHQSHYDNIIFPNYFEKDITTCPHAFLAENCLPGNRYNIIHVSDDVYEFEYIEFAETHKDRYCEQLDRTGTHYCKYMRDNFRNNISIQRESVPHILLCTRTYKPSNVNGNIDDIQTFNHISGMNGRDIKNIYQLEQHFNDQGFKVTVIDNSKHWYQKDNKKECENQTSIGKLLPFITADYIVGSWGGWMYNTLMLSGPGTKIALLCDKEFTLEWYNGDKSIKNIHNEHLNNNFTCINNVRTSAPDCFDKCLQFALNSNSPVLPKYVYGMMDINIDTNVLDKWIHLT
jgi:hypothetical protein